MKKVLLTITIGLTGLLAETAESIAQKSFQAVSGYHSSVAQTRMILKNAQGVVNTRKLLMKRFEKSNGDKSYIEFLFPSDIKGTKLLSYEQIATDDKQWLYLPELRRTKRISSRNKSGSFMASEFSYEDISTQNYKNYTYRGNAKKVKMQGKIYWEVERFPKDSNSGYSRQIAYVDPQTFLIKYGKYYDKQNRLLKTISFLKYNNIGGIYRVQHIEIKNVQNGKSSQLIWDQDQINMGLTENDFTKRVLK